MISTPSLVLPDSIEGKEGVGGGDRDSIINGAVSRLNLPKPLLHGIQRPSIHGSLTDVVITVTEVCDEEVTSEVKTGAGLEETGEDSICSSEEAIPVEMSSRIAAISRSRAASRETTPAPSRAVSRVPSQEDLNRQSIFINKVQTALHNHPLALDSSMNSSLPPSRRTSDPSQHWRGSSSNLTSSDSTPSSEHTPESGQINDSPMSGDPVTSIHELPTTNQDGNPSLYRMPIVGYEVLEERARFTVFKIHVFHQPTGDNWFVFRRYTDFVRLNNSLKREFPGVRFALPPKRWFGDNFDPIFLEDRQLGLQVFINNIISHTVIRGKKCVRDFFCLDNPMGPHDSLEESRALCQTLEETVSELQDRLREKESEVEVLRTKVNFLIVQQQTLVKALRLECELKSPVPPERGSSHDLNLALLNICEKTLDGGIKNYNPRSIRSSEVAGAFSDSGTFQHRRVSPGVESPLRRTLEKAFIPRSCSHNTLSPTHSSNSSTAVNGNRAAAKALFEAEGEEGASR